MKKLVALLTALVVLAAACGGGSGGVEASQEAFCAQSRKIDAATNKIDAESLPMNEQFKKTFDEVLPMMEDAIKVAPAEIKGDAETLVTGIKELKKQLEANDYDITKVDASLLNSPEFNKASDAMDAYGRDVCGIADSSSADPGPTAGDSSSGDSGAMADSSSGDSGAMADSSSGDSGAMADSSSGDSSPLTGGTLGEQMVAGLVESGFTQDEAECIIGEIDLGSLNADEVDPNFIFDALDACDISLERMAEIGS